MKNVLLVCLAAIVLSVSSPASAAELPRPLVDAYLQVQASLATDKFDGIAAHAKAIEAAVMPLGADAATIATTAKQLEAAKDIAAARKAFGELSEAVVAYADKTKSDLGDLRVAYCPMVNKPWLQKEKDIKNPYYGGAMLTCGSFKK